MSRTLVQLLAYIIRFCTSQARLSARLQLVLERVRMPQIHRRDLAWAVRTLPRLRQDQVLGTGRTPSPQVRAFRVGGRRCQDREDTPHSEGGGRRLYRRCPCTRLGRRHHPEALAYLRVAVARLLRDPSTIHVLFPAQTANLFQFPITDHAASPDGDFACTVAGFSWEGR